MHAPPSQTLLAGELLMMWIFLPIAVWRTPRWRLLTLLVGAMCVVRWLAWRMFFAEGHAAAPVDIVSAEAMNFGNLSLLLFALGGAAVVAIRRGRVG